MITHLGLGCAAQGNLFRPYEDDDALSVFEAAWDVGVRHFDTAPHYGLGLSEQRLGRFLATKPRDEYIVSTKVGRLLRPNDDWDGVSLDDQGFAVPARLRRVWDVSPDGIRASLEESLDRMGLDRVDILYLHDPEVSGIEGAVRSGMESLALLRAEGLVDRIGIGSMVPETLLAAVKTGVAEIVMVAGRYTLLDQSVAPDVLAACASYGSRIVAAAVFNSGLLAGNPRRDMTYDYVSAPLEVLGRARAIADVCSAREIELATAALHYPLLDELVDTVVVGAESAEQIRQTKARMDVGVDPQLWNDLDRRGLVPRLSPARTCA